MIYACGSIIAADSRAELQDYSRSHPVSLVTTPSYWHCRAERQVVEELVARGVQKLSARDMLAQLRLQDGV